MSETTDGGKTTPLDTRPVIKRGFVEREETIGNNPERSIFFNAFTSQPFKDRIIAGTNRVRRLKAESGFSILTNGTEIVYTPLNLGGRLPENLQDIALGHSASTSTGLGKISNDWLMEHKESEYPVLADFHFHPKQPPFSQEDIEYYDYIPVRGSSARAFGRRSDMFMGVFMPQFSGKSIDRLRLMMFAGPPTSNEYQAENFSRISVARQKELLEKSGMKVIIIDLPVVGTSIDFSNLNTGLLSNLIT